MIVEIDNNEYIITEEKSNSFFDRIELFTIEQYTKLPDVVKIGGQAVSRAFLAYAEKQEKDKEKKKQFKVERKSDPTLKVIHLLIEYIKVGICNVDTRIQTEGRFIKGISFQGTGGRHLLADGNEGEWKDNGRKNDRQHVVESVPFP